MPPFGYDPDDDAEYDNPGTFSAVQHAKSRGDYSRHIDNTEIDKLCLIVDAARELLPHIECFSTNRSMIDAKHALRNALENYFGRPL
jgi:hypothetical protein